MKACANLYHHPAKSCENLTPPSGFDPISLKTPEENNVASVVRLFFPEYFDHNAADLPIGNAPLYLTSQSSILPYLQTLLFEERLVCVQIEHNTRRFFTSLVDQLPEIAEEENGKLMSVQSDYEPGEYLKNLSHINLAPMEPVSGNLLVRKSGFLFLLFYTGTTSVEMGVFFKQIVQQRNERVIQCSFPVVARIMTNSRPFRAKVCKNQCSFIKILTGPFAHIQKEFELVDLSARGLAFASEVSLEDFGLSSTIRILLDSSSDDHVEVNAIVRHCAGIRKNGKTIHICGVEFDLETRALASLIERKFTALQRAFIRSLKEETAGFNIDLKL